MKRKRQDGRSSGSWEAGQLTKEEIKEHISMRDVLARYGYQPNRAGFINCPFHRGDRSASLKVYDKDFHCFGCGAHGDIFTFVMDMENCSFKEAFEILGGTYERQGFASDLIRYRAEKRKLMREKEAGRRELELQLNLKKIAVYKDWIEKTEPLSDVWCDCQNALQLELYHNEILRERG